MGERPLARRHYLDNFCEEILPFRLGNEPLEDWKEPYRHKFGHLMDSVQDSRNIREVCRKLCDILRNQYWEYVPGFYSPGLGPLTLLENRQGSCKEQTEFTACVLMSLVIPAYIDRIVQNANYHYQAHYWNYIRASGVEFNRNIYIGEIFV